MVTLANNVTSVTVLCVSALSTVIGNGVRILSSFCNSVTNSYLNQGKFVAPSYEKL